MDVKVDQESAELLRKMVATQFLAIMAEQSEEVGKTLVKKIFEPGPKGYGSPTSSLFTLAIEKGIRDLIDKEVERWAVANQARVSRLVDDAAEDIVSGDDFKMFVEERLKEKFGFVPAKIGKKASREEDLED